MTYYHFYLSVHLTCKILFEIFACKFIEVMLLVDKTAFIAPSLVVSVLYTYVSKAIRVFGPEMAPHQKDFPKMWIQISFIHAMPS